MLHRLAPALFPKQPYDVLRDLAPIAPIASGSYVLVVHPSVPARSVKDLIALAKARPGSLNFASSGPGGLGACVRLRGRCDGPRPLG